VIPSLGNYIPLHVAIALSPSDQIGYRFFAVLFFNSDLFAFFSGSDKTYRDYMGMFLFVEFSPSSFIRISRNRWVRR
jgi:hypothetical protein